MNGSARSGIGRRRGASARNKSPLTSALVISSTFAWTLLVGLWVYVSFLSSASTAPTVKGPKVAMKCGKNCQRLKGRLKGASDYLEGAGKGDKIDREVSETFMSWGGIIVGDLQLVKIETYGMHSVKEGTGKRYKGVKGSFCKLDWTQYKQDPPSQPMFRFLISASECDNPKHLVTVDLATAVQKSREYDNTREGHVIPPTGFVFHESRVGSTLVANSLTAMDPEGHRVYSESDPINEALKATGDKETAAELLRDVVSMMGRTSSPKERHMFFKVSSIGSKRIRVMQEAFPAVPWIFVYRDPVQTMMSHLDPKKLKKMRGGATKAVCLRAKRNPPDDLVQLVSDYGEDLDELSNEEFCAAHLATLCDSALRGLQKSDGMGIPVNYDGLVDTLIEKVIPDHFGVAVDEDARQRILDVSKKYSKGKGEEKDFVEDSETKDKHSTPEIREASDTFLSESYKELKQYSSIK
ncbi:hypothetical protein ACHAXT_007358 [Thalassiosira profunda]